MGTVPSGDLFPKHVLEIVEVELVLEAHREGTLFSIISP